METIIMAVLSTLIGIFAGVYSWKCNKNPINHVHFYVARDKYNNVLCLYLGKPVRGAGTFHSCNEGCAIEVGNYFFNFGLNPKDFENLKFEDEPVEVFLNLEE